MGHQTNNTLTSYGWPTPNHGARVPPSPSSPPKKQCRPPSPPPLLSCLACRGVSFFQFWLGGLGISFFSGLPSFVVGGWPRLLGVSRNLSQRAAPHARLVLAAWRSCAGFVPAPPTAAAAATLTIVRVTRRMVDIVSIVRQKLSTSEIVNIRNCQHIRPRKVNIMRVTRRMVDIVNIVIRNCQHIRPRKVIDVQKILSNNIVKHE